MPADHRARRLSEAHAAAGAGDYKLYHASIATAECDVAGKCVLVVGCNRGEDCKIFVDMGAEQVTGLDVMDEIGANFVHPNVSYRKASAEQMPFEDDSFDLVFAYATLEHVPDITAAFREMARVCVRGGLIYSAAAPLWNSRQGPHWGSLFDEMPWIHLRRSVEEVRAYNRAQGEANPAVARPSAAQVAYWLDDRFFNKRWARDYLAAGWSVPNVEIIRNDLECEPDEVLPAEVAAELAAKGYSRRELLALTHILIARRL
jgi:SAM-dependent methyltransferase